MSDSSSQAPLPCWQKLVVAAWTHDLGGLTLSVGQGQAPPGKALAGWLVKKTAHMR